MNMGVVKGPWSKDEDEKLLSYIREHGHGHWDALAHEAGLRRTGKSCRLRWLNYLRPGVRHGNISLREQLIILQLQSRWGNRWAKIAECLPGRSDNEIKNYWRTKVQKQANKLQCDVNSHRFRETMHHVWMPQLEERVRTQSEPPPTIITSPEYFNFQPSLSDQKFPEDDDVQNNDWNDFNDSSNSTAWNNNGEGVLLDADYPCHANCEGQLVAERQGELAAAAAWFDDDNDLLENLLNDEEMVLCCQELLDEELEITKL